MGLPQPTYRIADASCPEDLYRELFENASDLIYSIDLEGNFIAVNRAAERVSGYRPGELRKMNIAHLVAPECLDRARDMIQRTLRGEPIEPYDLEILTRDGRRVTLEINHRLSLDRGLPSGTHAIARETSSRRRAEAAEQDRFRIFELIARGEALEEILQRLVDMIERHDPTTMASVSLLRGGDVQPVAWSRLPGEVALDRAEPADHGLQVCASLPILSGSAELLGGISIYRKKNHSNGPVNFEVLRIAAGLASIAIDQRRVSEELAHQARHDALTGLPNRLLFHARLEEALAPGSRREGIVGLLYFDLDRFKLINDTLGHPAGDQVLRLVAQRLKTVMREGDTLARISGDEFTVIATGLKEPQDASAIAETILEALKPPLFIEEQELYLTASIGISLCPRDASDGEALQRHADSAMYRAKNRGRNHYQFFAPEMTASMLERLALENYLRTALERGEFAVHYQPQFELGSGKLVSHEALLRWRHPKLGMVEPEKFIPVAEESGLIVPIGAWVLQQACDQTQAWRKAGYPLRAVSVNVSAIQFARPDFISTIETALARSGLDPRCLELELTESLVMRDMDEFVWKMSVLRASGVRISVDDFGTGYSSLSYLQRLPIDILKLDRSFVEGFHESSSATSLFRSVVSLAHGIGMRVTAEGVETQEQLDEVHLSGCDTAQGFLLGRPLPAETALKSRVVCMPRR